jgi:hypothetical protein
MTNLLIRQNYAQRFQPWLNIFHLTEEGFDLSSR